MSHQASAIGHRLRRLIGAAAALALVPMIAAAQETGLPVGAKAPTSTMVETLDGKPFDLGSYIGKTPVLIEFWATWCPNCKQLEPAMAEAAKKYAGKMKFIGVAVSVNQSPERAKLYAEKHAIPMEMFYDKKGNAADAYDAAATSYIIVIDKTGTVVYTGLGASQNIDAAVKKGIGG